MEGDNNEGGDGEDGGQAVDPDLAAEENLEAGVQGNPEAGVQGYPEAGVQENPEAGVQGNPEAGVQGNPVAGVQGNPEAEVQGNPDAAEAGGDPDAAAEAAADPEAGGGAAGDPDGGGGAEGSQQPVRRPYCFRRNRPGPRSLYNSSLRALLRRYLPKQVGLRTGNPRFSFVRCSWMIALGICIYLWQSRAFVMGQEIKQRINFHPLFDISCLVFFQSSNFCAAFLVLYL